MSRDNPAINRSAFSDLPAGQPPPLMADVPWVRAPARLGEIPRADGGRDPAVVCRACEGDRSGHETYWPMRGGDHRRLARDFVTLRDGADHLQFAQRWGWVGTGASILVESPTGYASPSHWRAWIRLQLTGNVGHIGMYPACDDIELVLFEALGARWAYRTAVGADSAKRAEAEVAVKLHLRSLGLQFAPSEEMVVQLVPRSLLHVVYFAILGMFRGETPLVCLGWPAPGCSGTVPVEPAPRPGRPRLYCSQRCQERARARRRSRS